MDIDPSLLRAFVTVHETGGFGRAADRLHLSQSAVSHQIRRLEEQIGVSLLVRTTRRLALTEDGEDFLEHAEQILMAQDSMAQRFGRSSITNVVRFGVPDSFAGDWLPPLLAKFTRMVPSARLEVTVDTYLALHTQIGANALDLAITLAVDGDRPVGDLIKQTRFVWAAAQTFELAVHDTLPLAFAPKPCIHRQIGTDALERSGLEWKVAFTSPSQRGLRAAVQAGLAITTVPHEDLEPGMIAMDWHEGLPNLPGACFQLIRNGLGTTPAVEALVELVLKMPDAPADEA